MTSNNDIVGELGQPPAAAFESRVPLLLSVNVVLMTLATVFIFLRFYTRYVVLNRLGYDDWLALLALTFVLATGVTQCWMTQHGLGRHVETLPPPPPPPQPDDDQQQQLQTYTQLLWFSVLWYNTTILATKLALLAQYYRVLPIRSVRRACVALLVVIGLWGLAQVILSIFTCFPIQAYWDKDLRDVSRTANHAVETGAEETTTLRCIPALPLAYQNAAGNIATYIAVLVLPLPALSSLRLPRAQKRLLIGIFCLGFFTCAVAAIRIKYFREYTDPTWDHVDPSILSLTELCSGTVCLCLPTLRPLVARWLPASLTSTAASVTSNNNKGGGNRSTTNRSPIDDKDHPGGTGGGDLEKAATRAPKRPPPCVRAGASYYNSNTMTTSSSSSRRPSASLPRSSASGSDSDFIFGLETARKAVPESTPSPSPPPMCMSIIRPSALGGGSGSNSHSRRSSTAETSSVVRFAAVPSSSSPPFSSSSSTFSSSTRQQQQWPQRQYQQRRQRQQQQQQGNYYVHRDHMNNTQGGGYLRGQSSSNWLLESRVSTEIGTSSSPVPSEERRTLGSAAIRVKRMVTRRESVAVGW